MLLFVVSFILTIIVQSSNIITATLVPLCGIGIISLQKVYVMTLGSNIGTTVTGILTAFAQPSSAVKKAMQLAFVYTFFNTLGVLFWLPIPFLRFPKLYARKLGNLVFSYRWFLYVYVSFVFFIFPILIFLLALVPYWIGLAVFGIPLLLCVLFLAVVLVLRSKCAHILPEKLKSFNWLPVWLRSIEHYDQKFKNFRLFGKSKAKVTPSSRRVSIVVIPTSTHVIDSYYIEEDPGVLPSTIRRVSVMDGLVAEARKYSVINSITSNDSSSEEEYDNEEVLEYKRRKSLAHLGMHEHHNVRDEELNEEELAERF